jgi:hypothetical protein
VRAALVRTALLALPGAVATLFVAVVLSSRVEIVEAGDAVDVGFFLAVQAAALTVCRLGLDQLIFATLAADTTDRWSVPFGSIHARWLVPASALAVLPTAAVLGWWPAVAVAGSVALDTRSNLVAWVAAGRGRTRITTALQYLNYPAFVLVVCAQAAIAGPIDATATMLLFVAASAVRCAASLVWERRLVRGHADARPLPISAATVAVSGALAATWYLALRFDVLAARIGRNRLGEESTHAFLYLSRAVDITASLALLVAAATFGRELRGGALPRGRGLALIAAAWLGGVAVVVGALVLLWSGPGLPVAVMAGAAGSALLSLPWMASHQLALGSRSVSPRRMLLVEAATLPVGLVAAAVALARDSVELLALAGPVQLATFVTAVVVLLRRSTASVPVPGNSARAQQEQVVVGRTDAQTPPLG